MLWRAALLAVLAVVLPRTALCHWEYTRWGMTVEQVKAASDGQASDNATPEDQSTQTEDSLLIGRASEDGTDFKVFFMFDRRTKRLTAVILKLLDPTKGQAVYGRLVERHGKPISQLTTRATRVARWTDQQARNNIAWSSIGFANTTIRYSELRDAGRNL